MSGLVRGFKATWRGRKMISDFDGPQISLNLETSKVCGIAHRDIYTPLRTHTKLCSHRASQVFQKSCTLLRLLLRAETDSVVIISPEHLLNDARR